ncbi:condensation domain-containing protein [Allorhizocola rhizosphaerae]|uniref:condensation domain-containing protein n=1 Tax=Allorhizocola rhizosphaerae TaxID=1872709 RepID=UPI0013C2FA6D|nr:condensation domain-containing protein [Allorhizocola rhizosphaerae]
MRESERYRVHVEFAGERSGSGALTWGQLSMWKAMGRNPPGHFNIPMVVAAPRRPPATVPRVVDVLARLVERHEALRTTIDARPMQTVVSIGRLPVEVTEVGDANAVAGAVAELRARLSAGAFAYPQEFPMRTGLVAVDGQVHRIVLIFCHVATDWQGAEVVARDIRLMLRGAQPPTPRRHPLDLARWQQTEGQEQSRRAVDYWAGQHRSIPATMFAVEGDHPDPPHHQATLTSHALDGAARVVAARQRVSTTTVLLAATAGLIGARAGNSICAMHTLVSNRFQEGHADVVGMLGQNGLLVVDLADDPGFDQLVERTWRAALRCYRRAYYDQDMLDTALAEIHRERAAVVNPFCCFNDMRSTMDTEPGPPAALPDEAAIRAALPDSALTVSPHAPLNCRFCLRVEPATGPLTVTVLADSRALSGVHIGQLLVDLERRVVDAAFARQRV